MNIRPVLLLLHALLLASAATLAADARGGSEEFRFTNISYGNAVLWRPKTVADQRIMYGEDRSAVQFADLRIPDGPAPEAGFPVLVFLHGGAWRAEWSKDYSEALVEALTAEGFATWDLEFRRLGHRGGGYPGTFEDAGDGLDHLRVLTGEFPLDLTKVIVVGHSSGGHLALWLAGRHNLEKNSPLYRENPLSIRGVISIAGVNDLELALTLGNRNDVLELAGVDDLESGRDRFSEVNPARLLPLGVPQIQVIGDMDADWRLDMHERFEASAKVAGDDVRTIVLPGANHMDVVDAESGMAELLADIARELLAR